MDEQKTSCVLLLAGMLLFSSTALSKESRNAADARALGQDPTTEQEFSCQLLPRWNQYVLGEPVLVTVRLTNNMQRDFRFRDCEQHYPFYSFEVADAGGNPLKLSDHLNPSMGQINPHLRGIKSGRTYEVEINLAGWYDLSGIGTYTVKAIWCSLAKTAPYKRESNVMTIAVVPPEQKQMVGLIRNASLITQNSMSERQAQLKLVEVGERAVPPLLQWLLIEAVNGGRHGGWNSFHDLVRVLSQIGSAEGRDFIAHSEHIGPDRYRNKLLKRIDIWQSQDRFEKLVEALKEPRFDDKWVVFKLGALGDKRAIPFLEQIAEEHERLDIRETAKDALAHLQDPNIPMRYVSHLESERIKLTASAAGYRLGEPIRIDCQLVPGEYGSRTLAHFPKPAWHFLPWGPPYLDPQKSRPFILKVDRAYTGSGRPRYDRLLPLKDLVQARERAINTGQEPLDGYIDIGTPGQISTFTLEPGQSRHFVLEDLSSAFEISEPGEYRVYACYPGKAYVASEMITVNVLP